ncbi:DUF305 domain-containing protein [Mycolicibacterium diernhoferi]|uniref:DUF305 domain-containing protein n=1 Tax=Mycolicibacterium diernhoferi TaxID=1801 RepID=A0A1Q4H8D2_9MYCO|nr:DUF305 domain-containing protein [Mycolicibacterium diernhoferi]OJZ63810.1 DUF305 domain-containing protein [Mycolicibacterium diernhoferi]OPE45322.1 DUF305 domain-containing protein [Mycolicibacterium diernhoferi]PEG54300.1 DUF305 domain-containing protein [Mycolicibacterium diernhoferi]QYL21551.1 DUF305 domain-containing protein [Mycolicibacterium diernhoferi]
MRKPAIMVATAAVAALIAAGCTNQSAETSDDGHTDHDHGTSHHSGSGASPGPVDGAHDGAHNGADVMFAQHMIPHHRQAVEMSDILLLKQDVDPRVRKLAEEIKAAQAPEIEQMQSWLTSWGNPPMPDMDHGSMEGMVAPADIEKLRSAPGPEAARLFLTQMIGHHEGAITMAQTEIDDGQHEPAIAMARAIIDSQQREIDEMKQILESL